MIAQLPEAGFPSNSAVKLSARRQQAARWFRGTVFSVSTSGTEHVLASFCRGQPDGADPIADLIAIDDLLLPRHDVYGRRVAQLQVVTGRFHILRPSSTSTVLYRLTRHAGWRDPATACSISTARCIARPSLMAQVALDGL